jgi:hypothetical protein
VTLTTFDRTGYTPQTLFRLVALPGSGAGLAVLLPLIWRSSAEHDSKKV